MSDINLHVASQKSGKGAYTVFATELSKTISILNGERLTLRDETESLSIGSARLRRDIQLFTASV